MKNSLILLTIVFIVGCDYQTVDKSAITNTGKTCEEFIAYMDKNWLKHKTLPIFKCKDNEGFIKNIRTTYKPCFQSLTYTDIEIIFGKPNEISTTSEGELIYLYYTQNGCTEKYEYCQGIRIFTVLGKKGIDTFSNDVIFQHDLKKLQEINRIKNKIKD